MGAVVADVGDEELPHRQPRIGPGTQIHRRGEAGLDHQGPGPDPGGQLDGLLQRSLRRTGLAQELAELALLLEGCEQEEFARDVLVVALLRQLVGLVQQPAEIVRDMHVALAALHRWQALEHDAEPRAQLVDVDAGLRQQVARAAALLVEQRDEQVHRLDELVVAADRKALCILQRELEFAGEFVHSHGD